MLFLIIKATEIYYVVEPALRGRFNGGCMPKQRQWPVIQRLGNKKGTQTEKSGYLTFRTGFLDVIRDYAKEQAILTGSNVSMGMIIQTLVLEAEPSLKQRLLDKQSELKG